ncbi:hypothetical protein BABINDRAFT_167942 [Babjeviella inositovora NRRL Y-12698]|uniref:Uncharacterized protein n=1 Tax=Babjeviella inositovora NRRL Y-12698 TaxID=984486 RepID=A0A1E3QNT9_9ASCO|nr:uncharacterized protein BABINDRAFT_167942 [Babjeviella inositovora NRRL Y-12698]ODQ78752.1 hypothetical protein BABINDRAFT_167942 [Babjeviella inositovora NRRL Y-12698]
MPTQLIPSLEMAQDTGFYQRFLQIRQVAVLLSTASASFFYRYGMYPVYYAAYKLLAFIYGVVMVFIRAFMFVTLKPLVMVAQTICYGLFLPARIWCRLWGITIPLDLESQARIAGHLWYAVTKISEFLIITVVFGMLLGLYVGGLIHLTRYALTPAKKLAISKAKKHVSVSKPRKYHRVVPPAELKIKSMEARIENMPSRKRVTGEELEYRGDLVPVSASSGVSIHQFLDRLDTPPLDRDFLLPQIHKRLNFEEGSDNDLERPELRDAAPLPIHPLVGSEILNLDEIRIALQRDTSLESIPEEESRNATPMSRDFDTTQATLNTVNASLRKPKKSKYPKEFTMKRVSRYDGNGTSVGVGSEDISTPTSGTLSESGEGVSSRSNVFDTQRNASSKTSHATVSSRKD